MEFIVVLGVAVLNLVATVKIITKAGYSGWWILAPLSPVVLTMVTSVVGVRALASAFTLRSVNLRATGALLVLDLLSVLFSEIVLLIFAFAEWPALRWQRNRLPLAAGGRPQDQFLPIPARAQDPGWYQVGVTNNDQAYWDGQGWTARRRWDGAGWTEEQPRQPDPEP